MKLMVALVLFVALGCAQKTKPVFRRVTKDLNLPFEKVQSIACNAQLLHEGGKAYRRVEMLKLLGLPDDASGAYCYLNLQAGEVFRLSPSYYLSITLTGECQSLLLREDSKSQNGMTVERQREVFDSPYCEFNSPVVVRSDGTFPFVASPSCDMCLKCPGPAKSQTP